MRFVLTILGLAVSASAFAEAPRVPGQGAAERLTLHEAVDIAWKRLPDRRTFEGRRAAADARLGAAGAVFPNAPYFNGTYVNDAVGSGQHYTTYQGEFSTPIWLPGEGTATGNVARSDLSTLGAEVDAAHLALAGQVLDLVAQAALAANTRDVARRRLITGQSLAADLDRRARIGEAAEADALAARAEASSAQLDVATAEAQVAASRTGLASVIGVDAIPLLETAPSPAADALDPMNHPRVVAAQKAVDAARSSIRLAEIQNRDSPTIGIQGIHEKQGFASPYNTRFGVVVHVPFATEARNAPLRAAAQSALTAAEARLALEVRQVVAEQRQASAILGGARRASDAAGRAAAALSTRRGQIERAWRSGEMPLLELVRANASAYDAELARDKARTNLGVSQQRARLALGLLP